jgi:hypothetical protein
MIDLQAHRGKNSHFPNFGIFYSLFVSRIIALHKVDLLGLLYWLLVCIGSLAINWNVC